MRAASPPRQMERENEMIVISQPLFCFLFVLFLIIYKDLLCRFIAE